MTKELASPEKASAGLFLIDQALSYAYPAALRAAAILGVADHLVDRSKTADELAEATGTDPLKLYRVLRLLASRGVFREDEQGRFALTPPAELLRADVPLSIQAGIRMLTSKALWMSAGGLVDCLRGGSDPSFEQLFGTKIFNYWSQDLPPEEEFHAGMASQSASEILALARSYEFPEGATVVDVGAGLGGLLLLILQENPSLHGILFDQEHVLPRNRLGELGDDDRWETVAGDFFKEAPRGDVYVLKYIMHDWDDERCVQILRNCRKAMAPGGRVVIFDPVIPSGNEPHTGKLMDIVVMSIYPGRERTAEDFRQLLAEADLRLNRVIDTGTFISIVEAVPA